MFVCLSVHRFLIYLIFLCLVQFLALFLSLSLSIPVSVSPPLSFPVFLSPCPSPHVSLSFSRSISPYLSLFFSLSPWLFVDISVSLLAVVVGFCGLALLVVSLFVFWKLCWPIWRSKALSSHADNNGLRVGLPEAPPPILPPVLEPKVAMEEEKKKKKVPEVKLNGRSSVKLLEAAMKISQTSPDIPAEVQTALRERLSQQAKIQRQTTEPTSSSRYTASGHGSDPH